MLKQTLICDMCGKEVNGDVRHRIDYFKVTGNPPVEKCIKQFDCCPHCFQKAQGLLIKGATE